MACNGLAMKKSFEPSQFLYYTQAQRTLRKKYGKQRKRRAAWKWQQGVFTATDYDPFSEPLEAEEEVRDSKVPAMQQEVLKKAAMGKVLLNKVPVGSLGQGSPKAKSCVMIRFRETTAADGK